MVEETDKGANIYGYISEYCPNCEAEIEWRAGLFPRNTLGPELEKCPHCGEEYATGRKEWSSMSTAQHREYYRRTVLRCLAVFAFWFMGVMLAAFIITGAIFQQAKPEAIQISLVVSVIGGVLLSVRVIQRDRQMIAMSLEREPLNSK